MTLISYERSCYQNRTPKKAKEVRVMVVGDTESPLKCLAGVCHQMPTPQCHIRGEARSQLEYGLGVLLVSPPWVEGPMHDQIGDVGSQWV